MDNLFNVKKKYSSYDIASFIAMEKFQEKHPKEMQPKWLERYVMVTGRKIETDKWIMRKILFHKIQLEANQYWKQSMKGNPILIEVDPTTGEEFVVLGGGSAENIEVIFEVEVDLVNGLATVLTDTDFNILDETKYQVQRVQSQ